jgi:GxxExxY protein
VRGRLGDPGSSRGRGCKEGGPDSTETQAEGLGRSRGGLTTKIIAAAIAVHKELGPGFLESIYENALAVELRAQDIPFQRQLAVPVLYRGVEVGLHRLDLFAFDEIVVALEAVSCLENVHHVVVRSYLRAANREHGLLLDSASPALEIERVTTKRLG